MGDSSFPLALRPTLATADDDESLMLQLQRISHQFGQFRHMNEDKLREMAAAQGDTIADTSDTQDDDDDTDDAKKRLEELRDAKADMFKHIKYVLHPANP